MGISSVAYSSCTYRVHPNGVLERNKSVRIPVYKKHRDVKIINNIYRVQIILIDVPRANTPQCKLINPIRMANQKTKDMKDE